MQHTIEGISDVAGIQIKSTSQGPQRKFRPGIPELERRERNTSEEFDHCENRDDNYRPAKR